ncbi:MAG: hypothetical protein JO249_13055 [Acidobacteria bacterium]|nr:hypothetical protein [Acidobacteriota bacterium]
MPLRRIATLALYFIFVFHPSALISWGPEGHEVIATLAQTRLTGNARRGVQWLIGEASLASIANWADEIRPERDETYNWHFVDIPMNASGFSDARDCFLPESKHKDAENDHQNCVVDRIEFFQQILSDDHASTDSRREALQFLVHFVGDIHQPLHAVAEAAGGNRIHVTEFGSAACGQRPCNLHGVWDSGLIEHTNLTVDQYVAKLDELIVAEHLSPSGNAEDWANESHDCARAAWLNEGAQVDENYYREQITIVDRRLALAGLRLAALLNGALR